MQNKNLAISMNLSVPGCLDHPDASVQYSFGLSAELMLSLVYRTHSEYKKNIELHNLKFNKTIPTYQM